MIEQASRWAERILADGGTSVRDRVQRMFLRALGRPATAAELTASLDYLASPGRSDAELLGQREVWRDFAHSLFNLKEFLYLR